MISTDFNSLGASSRFFAGHGFTDSQNRLVDLQPRIRMDFRSTTVEGSQSILNQQVNTSLAETTGVYNKSQENQYYTDYSPESVADRILQSITGLIRQANVGQTTSHENQELMNQIRDGIEMGFNQAREILTNLGALNGEIASNVDKTQNLVEDGLSRLFEGVSTNPEHVEAHSRIDAYQHEQSQSFDLEIETLDGDLVRIQFEKNAAQSETAFSVESDAERFIGSTKNSFYSENFSFTVQGELDESELSDISHLIQQSGEFTQKFSQGLFDGRLNEAVHFANNLGLETPQLAEFDLNFEFAQTTKAVSAYQQMQAPKNTSQGRENVVLAAEFVQDSQKLLQQNHIAIDRLNQAHDAVKNLVLELTQFTGENPEPNPRIVQDDERLLAKVFDDLQSLRGRGIE